MRKKKVEKVEMRKKGGKKERKKRQQEGSEIESTKRKGEGTAMRCGEPLICVSDERCQESASATALPEGSLAPLVLDGGRARD